MFTISVACVKNLCLLLVMILHIIMLYKAFMMDNKDRENWVGYSFCAVLGLVFIWGAVSNFTAADPLFATVTAAVSCLLLWFLLTPIKKLRKGLFMTLAWIVAAIYVGGTFSLLAAVFQFFPVVLVPQLVENGNYLGAAILSIVIGFILIIVHSYTKPRILKTRDRIRNGPYRFW